jgi:hypothetical protein
MSHCLKLYCECFTKDKDCDDSCNCEKSKCGNKNGISSSKSKKRISPEDGCRCKESECQKNYCICFRSGKVCNSNCVCTLCKNTMYNTNKITNYYNNTKRRRLDLNTPEKQRNNIPKQINGKSKRTIQFLDQKIFENEKPSIEEYIKLTQKKSYISKLQENVDMISSSNFLINEFSIHPDEFSIHPDEFSIHPDEFSI